MNFKPLKKKKKETQVMAYYVFEMHYRKAEYSMEECKTIDDLRKYLFDYCVDYKHLLVEGDLRDNDECAFWDEFDETDNDPDDSEDVAERLLEFIKTLSNEGLIHFIKNLGCSVIYEQAGFGIVEVIGGVRF